MAATVTINDVLDGHVVLDVECLDRIYLNGYVPNLQVSGQVASFMTAHLVHAETAHAVAESAGIDRCGLLGEHPRDATVDLNLRAKTCGSGRYGCRRYKPCR